MPARSLVRLCLSTLLLNGSLIASATAGTDAPTSVALPLSLPFEAFFARPVGPRGLEPSARLLAADGQRVTLSGYMVAREQGTPGRFQLTPRPVRLSEHADGEADDLPPSTVTVLLDPTQRDRLVAHQPGLLTLTGRLAWGRSEGPDGRVSWLRLQLEPEALAAQAMRAGEAAPHRHP